MNIAPSTRALKCLRHFLIWTSIDGLLLVTWNPTVAETDPWISFLRINKQVARVRKIGKLSLITLSNCWQHQSVHFVEEA